MDIPRCNSVHPKMIDPLRERETKRKNFILRQPQVLSQNVTCNANKLLLKQFYNKERKCSNKWHQNRRLQQTLTRLSKKKWKTRTTATSIDVGSTNRRTITTEQKRP